MNTLRLIGHGRALSIDRAAAARRTTVHKTSVIHNSDNYCIHLRLQLWDSVIRSSYIVKRARRALKRHRLLPRSSSPHWRTSGSIRANLLFFGLCFYLAWACVHKSKLDSTVQYDVYRSFFRLYTALCMIYSNGL
jgi:hypothetical protein